MANTTYGWWADLNPECVAKAPVSTNVQIFQLCWVSSGPQRPRGGGIFGAWARSSSAWRVPLCWSWTLRRPQNT